MKKIDSILKLVLEKINPSKEELTIIKNSLKEFVEKFEKELKKKKIDAEIFVGGSFAKNTLIKKDYYDLDIFIRFNKTYNDKEISKLTGRILKEFVNVSIVHGSRDYFKVDISPSFFIEVVPVIKVKNPKESRNITDLSYSHVKYIKRKIKSKKILEEIKLAKVFCYANHCYGAESYINGFSGYGLELLVYHYKGFLNFLKAIIKIQKKEVIDLEKQYKNKQTVLMNVNSSKLKSPIILIDPTYKQRNVLAALSEETFEKFQKVCKKFLKNPSIKAFEIEKIDLEKIKKQAVKRKYEFILLETKTTKQEGDIAGSKLLKFYKHLESEIKKFFEVKNKGFNYNNKKSARSFFVVKTRKEILIEGPSIKDKKNLMKFKKKHKSIFVKGKRIYSRKKIEKNIKEFIKYWLLKNKRKLRDMHISKLEVIKVNSKN